MKRFILKHLAKGMTGPEISLSELKSIILIACLSLIIILGYSANKYHTKYPHDMWLKFWLEDISPASQRERSDRKHEELKRKHRTANDWEYPVES